MKNTIYLRRKNKLLVEQGSGESTKRMVMTVAKNMQNLGYLLEPKILTILETYSKTELIEFYKTTILEMKVLKGAHVEYCPMYPNFPQQVMDASAMELFFNALIHYWSLGEIKPEYTKEERSPLFETEWLKCQKVELGSEKEFVSMFENLLQSKTSLSETDKTDLMWFADHYPFIEILPEVIPLKENLALVAKILTEQITDGVVLSDILSHYFSTATDVLRYATAVSDGDTSLASNTKFKSFGRKQRKLILALLETAFNIEEDMKRNKEVWKRLGERLHPFEYQKKYPKACAVFKKLFENKKIETFAGKFQAFIDQDQIAKAVNFVKQRPGEFARRLDVLVRRSKTTEKVVETIKAFEEIVDKVSSPVLLQVKTHFANRGRGGMRVFFPKGSVAKIQSIENNLPKIAIDICTQIVVICTSALLKQFAERKPLGKVYIDPILKNYLVPFSQRSASKALKTLVRGSRVDMPKNITTVRSFVYWKQAKNNRVDLDLSAMLFNDNWKYIEHISYTHLKDGRYNSCHSGDITAAPEGASEFIDLDIDSILKFGARYVVVCVLSYTEQAFIDIPECFMGWMARTKPKSGEIYEPKTVKNKIDIAAAGQQVCIPMILDLKEKQVVWADIGGLTQGSMRANVESNSERLTKMGRAMTELKKANLYDLFTLHANARGIMCDNPEEADTVFSLEEGITPFEFDVIMGQYL